MSWLLSKEGKIYYRTTTDQLDKSDIILFIHGAGLDSTVWDRVFPLLKNRYGIIALDLPGHGKSEGEVKNSLTEYLPVIDQLIEQFPNREIYLAGHSMGGAISLLYASENCKKINGIIVLNSSYKLPVNSQILEILRTNFQLGVTTSVQFSFGEFDDEFYREMYKKILLHNGQNVLTTDLTACNNYLFEDFGQIHKPVSVISGSLDKMVSPKGSKKLCGKLHDCNFELIDDVGHSTMLENPKEVAKIISDFIL